MATSDRLRERWDSMTPRERWLMTLLGISLVVIPLIFIGLKVSDGLKLIEAKNDSTRRALAALSSYRLSQPQKDAPQEVIGDTPIKLETYLSGVADEVGIKIPAFNPLTPVTRDGFTENSTKIEIRMMSIQELKGFLEKVEGKSQQVVVKSLNVRRHFRDKDKLDVSMVVSTFSKAKAEGQAEEKTEG